MKGGPGKTQRGAGILTGGVSEREAREVLEGDSRMWRGRGRLEGAATCGSSAKKSEATHVAMSGLDCGSRERREITSIFGNEPRLELRMRERPCCNGRR